MTGSNYLALGWTCTLYPCRSQRSSWALYRKIPNAPVTSESQTSVCHDTINEYPGVACILISSELMSYLNLSEWQTSHFSATWPQKRIGNKLYLWKMGLMWNFPCLWRLWKMPRGQDSWWFSKTLIKLQICCFYSPRQIFKLATHNACAVLGSPHFLRFLSATTSYKTDCWINECSNKWLYKTTCVSTGLQAMS